MYFEHILKVKIKTFYFCTLSVHNNMLGGNVDHYILMLLKAVCLFERSKL